MTPGKNTGIVTILFTDIEGSTRLWEQEPEPMSSALARHDAIAHAAVEAHRGVVVKIMGDGILAAFDDPLDGVAAALELQLAFTDSQETLGVALRVRCGLHLGSVERRNNDLFGTPVNRAARIMAAAHGGQVLVSQAVAGLVADRLSDDVTLLDLGAVRLRDLASPERVFQVVHRQLRREFPALRALEATPNNLVHQITSFVGREREVNDVKRLLRDARLVTLHGVGGLGKTRLSLQIAADVIDEYADGVWFVDLAPIVDAHLVPQAVASVIGVKEQAGRPVVEALVEFVKDRRLLLILDNCEHVAPACAELAKQVLNSGSQVKILATSRENLRVAGETLYELPPLAAPTPQQRLSPFEVMRYEAVRLFVERASAAQSSFQLSEANVGAISEICRRLDGIPLALELAAARVGALSVENILRRLTDRFRLLKAGDQTALPRQQTLRALIDWSHELLTAPEQIMFRRLGVFVSGWTLEAAEAVCGEGDIGKADVLDLMTRLVEKSLVVWQPQGERYRLLETVREYALEKLNEAGEGDNTGMRHLAFHLSITEAAQANQSGPEQRALFARLDIERENILSAHDWCDRADGGAELGLRFVHSMKQYWVNRGLLDLGHRVALNALTRVGANRRDRTRCLALIATAQLSAFMERGEAQAFAEEALSIAREIEDGDTTWMALQALAIACDVQGDRGTALGHYEESLALARKGGSKQRIATTLHNLAELRRGCGEMDGAAPLYEEALALAREQGDRSANTAVTLRCLAVVSIERGLGDRARAMLFEAFEIVRETGSKFAGATALNGCAELAAFFGEWKRAARLHGAADAQGQKMGLPRAPATAPLIERVREAIGAPACDASETAGRVMMYEEAIAEARAWLQDAH